MIMRGKNDYRRDVIAKYDLLQYMDQINLKERYKQIVREYVSGLSITELSKKYEVSRNAIGQTVARYIGKCSKLTGGRYLWRYGLEEMEEEIREYQKNEGKS